MSITRASQRFRLLLAQLEQEAEGRHGWKAQVAERIGVSPALVSQVVAGARNAGLAAVEGAIDGLGIRSGFFFDALPEPPDYRDYLEDPEGPPARYHPGVVEAVDRLRQSPRGRKVTDEEAELLCRQHPPVGIDPSEDWAFHTWLALTQAR